MRRLGAITCWAIGGHDWQTILGNPKRGESTVVACSRCGRAEHRRPYDDPSLIESEPAMLLLVWRIAFTLVIAIMGVTILFAIWLLASMLSGG